MVALTGLALFGFVVGHMIGNLQIFLGWEALNRYGAFLQGAGELLWIIRLGLLIMVLLHIYFTIQLRIESRGAREQKYAVTRYPAASFPARWMMLSGLMVLCFLIYHLLHFTVQVPAVNLLEPAINFREMHDAKARHDVYQMMVRGFQQPVISAFYVLSVGLLAMHLQHGIQSMSISLGLSSAKVREAWQKGGVALAWLIFLGYAVIPIAVLAKLVK